MVDSLIQNGANPFQEFDSRLTEVLGNLFGRANSPKESADCGARFAANAMIVGVRCRSSRFSRFIHAESPICTTNTLSSMRATDGVSALIEVGKPM